MAKDIIHDVVKHALVKDGWTITADPYVIAFGDDKLFVDLAAEQTIAAERNNTKIAVEIKSFIGRSPLHDFEIALGQYMLYLGLLELTDPERRLYLAINHIVFATLFQQATLQTIMQRYQLRLIIVNLATQEVQQWID